MPTALIAWIDIRAWASRPSSLRSHCTWLPRPGGTPCTMTSNAPPIVSPASRALSISAIIRCSSSASDAVKGGVFADRLRICERHGQRIRHRRRADAEDVADDLGLDLAQQLPGDGADGDACGGFARAGALEDVPDVVVPVLDHAREVGVAGPRTRHHRTIDAGALPAAGRSRPPSSAASSPSPCSESAARSDRRSSRRGGRRSTPARDPTRWPCAVRGRSRSGAGAAAVVIASKSRARPAGMPSRMVTSAWPCDSPAVRNRSIRVVSFYPMTSDRPQGGLRGGRWVRSGVATRTPVVRISRECGCVERAGAAAGREPPPTTGTIAATPGTASRLPAGHGRARRAEPKKATRQNLSSGPTSWASLSTVRVAYVTTAFAGP